MNPAHEPRRDSRATRLLYADAQRASFTHTRLASLPELLSPLDLLVVNDAATLPAALRALNHDVEVRLIGHTEDPRTFRAVVFGGGDYHIDTDARPPPAEITLDQRLEFGPELAARVVHIDAESQRLLRLRFETGGVEFWRALYRYGRPIQYRHVPAPLELWDVQNLFASRPFAFEPPSAGLSFDFALLAALKQRGVGVVALTHAAGVSALGSPALDVQLPLAERYEIPETTRAAIAATRARAGRVVAVGTSVVRALEASRLEHGELCSGASVTELRLGPGFELRVVDALLTGMHEAGSSHFELLQAFAARALLLELEREAQRLGYLSHEFGDSCLIEKAASAAQNAPTRRAA